MPNSDVHGWSMHLVCFLVHIVMMAITRTLLDRMSTSTVHAEGMTGFVCRPLSDKRTIPNFFASLASCGEKSAVRTPGKDHSQCPKKKLGLKAVFMRFYCGRKMRREGEMRPTLTTKPPFVVLMQFLCGPPRKCSDFQPVQRHLF